MNRIRYVLPQSETSERSKVRRTFAFRLESLNSCWVGHQESRPAFTRREHHRLQTPWLLPWLLDIWPGLPLLCDPEGSKRKGSTHNAFLVPGPLIPLFILWDYRGVAKDYPNCCYTLLRRDLQ